MGIDPRTFARSDPPAIAIPGYDRCWVGFSPKGEWLGVGTGSRYDFYRSGTWQLDHSIPCGTGEDPGWLARIPAHRNTVFALEPEDFSLSMHSVEDFKRFTRPHFERQRPLKFHPNGALLLTTDPSHHIHLWNMFLIREVLEKHGLDVMDERGRALSKMPNPDGIPIVERSIFGDTDPAPLR